MKTSSTLSRSLIASYLAIPVWWLTTISCALALPPESSLPQTSAVPKTISQLPTESSLPGQAAGQHQSQPALAQLPSEQSLPLPVALQPKVADAPLALDQVGQLPELQGSRDSRVRLRLSVPEHTSNVFTHAFDATSTHLFTGGDDKLVHHWRLVTIPESNTQRWMHEESIRWQVGSGPSGRVRAIACSGNVLLISGYGADGQRGEILRYDWVQRNWLKPYLFQNRPIVDLFALAGGQIVGLDEYSGVALYRLDDSVAPRWLRNPQNTLAANSPISVRAVEGGVEWLGPASPNNNPWSIISRSSVNNSTRTWNPTVQPGTEPQVFSHLRQQVAQFRPDLTKDLSSFYSGAGMVHGRELTLLSSSPDGRMLAAVDSDVKNDEKGGWLYVWRDGKLILKTMPTVKQGQVPPVYSSLSWSADSQQLAALKVKTEGDQSTSKVELWSFKSEPVVEELANQYGSQYLSCQFSPDSQWLVLSGRVAVYLLPLKNRPIQHQRLPEDATILPLTEVAFANSGYQWKATHARGQVTFDPARMAMVDAVGNNWQPALKATNGFQSGEYRVDFENQLNVVKRGQIRLGSLDPLLANDPQRVAAVQWIRNANQVPTHVAVAYKYFRAEEIHLFALDKPENGRLRCVGKLNGHEGRVLSLTVSSDQRIMMSCGEDRQLCTWPLFAILNNQNSQRTTWQRYGAIFEIVADKLTVAELHPAGPLFEFGLRAGDEISGISWFKASADGTQVEEQVVPLDQQALSFLDQPDFDRVVKFSFGKAGAEPKMVQLKPQWRPLLSQVFDSGREWAAWTAPGFYAASFNGNSIFGWQINRGAATAPSFYRADRFQTVLERPELLKRVIELGSVDAAARAIGETLTSTFNPLENSIALQPTVNILSPLPNAELRQADLTVEAEVLLPRGSDLASVKAFANGVPAKLVSQTTSSADATLAATVVRVTWHAGLPNDRDIKLQVLAANSQRLVGAAELILHRQVAKGESVKPRLWIFAGGAGDYQDRRVPDLKSPERNVEEFTAQITRAAKGIYNVQKPIQLIGSAMTRTQWMARVHDQCEYLRDIVQPDDLVMIFLSGHGIQDEKSGGYYYIPVDVDFKDVRAGEFERCLGINEIAPLGGLMCRKVVVLDTCYSAAFQPLESDRLRSAVRVLQADLILTLTASEGDQPAAEVAGKSLFTDVVLKTLSSPNDRDHDRLLTWPEFVKQVQEGVIKRATATEAAAGFSQKPTFVPSELLPYVRLPIAQVESREP